MFYFFTTRKWMLWSLLGGAFILFSTWYQVQLDVKINEWFGEFYDTLQKALAEPNSVSLDEFVGYLFTFLGCQPVDRYRGRHQLFCKPLAVSLAYQHG